MLSMRLPVLAHGGEPIRCDPSGCCLWISRASVAAARRRLYEASRGGLPSSARVESVCGTARCVNLDHLRVRTGARVSQGDAAKRECLRGHELSPQNVVRHRDGRIAYCRLCRNERRRERYRTDTTFAEREVARQRQLRTHSRRASEP